MPKFFGSNIISLVLATIAFYMLGFLWYSFLFVDQWMHLTGITATDALVRGEQLGAMMYVWGLLITLAQVLGTTLIQLLRAYFCFETWFDQILQQSTDKL